MVTVDLPLGPLSASGFTVQRSGIRWRVPDGHRCRAGEVVAFCNIGLSAVPSQRQARRPFHEEFRDLQVTFAPTVAGTLRRHPDASLGGFLDQLHNYHFWNETDVVAALEVEDGQTSERPAWRLGFNAGLRMTDLAEDRSGLLTGWHLRARAWQGELAQPATVLSLGICEQDGIFRGESNAFLDLMETGPDALQVVHHTDRGLVPAAAVLSDQLRRNAAANTAISADLAQGFLGSSLTPTPEDWIFAGCALTALTRSPLTEEYDLLTRQGLTTAKPQAVVLSIHSEPAMVLRHRKFGYRAAWHRFRIQMAGPAVREWLQTSFDRVIRTPEDILQDLLSLRQAIAERGIDHMLVLNAMSSSGHENIVSYAPFSGALGDVVSTIRAKELNLMLHDLAAKSDIAIVDADAIAAYLGGAAHLPDGVHQSRRLQDELRAEILHILKQRGLFGQPDAVQNTSAVPQFR
jgi:hypothetical protein